MFDLPKSILKRIGLFGLALAFGFAGIGHFTSTDQFVAIVPPYLPEARALVYISGVFEILGALGVLLGRTRLLAGYGLIALLIAVYPANIHMALHPEDFAASGMSPTGLYVRLPIQFLLMLWVWWATRPDAPVEAAA
jgi:uncharacterized membrane protein